jgi:hypothetical protein
MRKEPEMNVRQMMFSIPETLQATLAFPEPPTPEVLRVLEGVSTLVCRAVGGAASDEPGLDAGEIEYASWRQTSDRGEIEYASWFANLRAGR